MENGKPKGHGHLAVADLQLVNLLYLRGNTMAEIGRRTGRSCEAVSKLIERHLRPQWKERLKVGLEEEIAKLDHLEAVAWQCFEESKKPHKETTKRTTLQTDLADAAKGTRYAERVSKMSRRCGSAAYLKIALECRRFKCELAGFLRPEQVGATTINVVKVVVENRQQYLNVQQFIEKAKLGETQ